MKDRISEYKNGFSLIELCIGIIISGLLLAAGLKAFNLYLKKQQIEQTNARLEKIEDVINAFADSNRHYPCPAPIDAASDTPGYGEATTCSGPPVAGVTEVTGRDGRKVRIGALPVRTLELSDTYIADGWGRRYTYAVSVPLTAAPLNNDEGAITVRDTNDTTVIDGTAHFVLLSHGPDGKGAYAAGGGLFMGCTATAGKDQDNCAGSDAIFRVSQNRSTAPGNNFYDDFAIFSTGIDTGNPAEVCSARLRFYSPGHPDADADGCVGFIPECEEDQSLTARNGQFECVGFIPECGPEQTVTAVDGEFTCVGGDLLYERDFAAAGVAALDNALDAGLMNAYGTTDVPERNTCSAAFITTPGEWHNIATSDFCKNIYCRGMIGKAAVAVSLMGSCFNAAGCSGPTSPSLRLGCIYKQDE